MSVSRRSKVRFPGETEDYRKQREALLDAELALRAQIEQVARLRRELPLGGQAADYEFDSAQGAVRLSELFGGHETLIIYSYMFAEKSDPCPMCSAFIDNIIGQLQPLSQRVSFAVVARSPIARIQKLVDARGWHDIRWLSAARNDYPIHYWSEMPDGTQVPACNVFVRRREGTYHFWHSEAFFAASDTHPRHLDMIWPLWHLFDLTPEGRGEFMPSLTYD